MERAFATGKTVLVIDNSEDEKVTEHHAFIFVDIIVLNVSIEWIIVITINIRLSLFCCHSGVHLPQLPNRPQHSRGERETETNYCN
jgi:hypothetical protein